MPTYEYECTKCGELFELFQSIKDAAKKSIKCDCRECNNKAPVVRRIGIGGGVIFKGSGFYQTDYRSESYKKAAEADKPSTGTPAADKAVSDKVAKDAKEPTTPTPASDSSSKPKPPPKTKPKDKK